MHNGPQGVGLANGSILAPVERRHVRSDLGFILGRIFDPYENAIAGQTIRLNTAGPGERDRREGRRPDRMAVAGNLSCLCL